MYIIIAGGGVVGRSIASMLSNEHSVVVIDKDFSICEKIYSTYGVISVHGDATKIGTLIDAGIQKCDIAISVMREDSSNLVFALLSKNFGISSIFVRMHNPEYENAYKIAGASNIASSVGLMVDKFVMDIMQPEIRRVASLSGGKAEISILTIPVGAKCSGCTISEIASSKFFPDDCVIAGIFDSVEDKLIVPRGNRRIFSSNQVFLVAPSESIMKAAKFLRKK